MIDVGDRRRFILDQRKPSIATPKEIFIAIARPTASRD